MNNDADEIFDSLPTKYHPKSEGEFARVPVGPVGPETMLERDDTRNLADRMNAMAVPDAALAVLEKAGINVEQRGLLQVSHGYSIVTANALLNAMLQVAEGINDPKTARESAKALGYLAGQLHKFQKSLKEDVPPTVVPVAQSGKKMKFPAGAKITQINHYHAAGEKPVDGGQSSP